MMVRLRAGLLLIGIIAGLFASSLPARPTSGAEPICGTLASDKGQLQQTVNIPTAGTYTMWLRMLAPNTNSDSVFVQVDGKCVVVAGDSRLSEGFQWVQYREGDAEKRLSFNLTAGDHSIVIAGREAGAGLDRVLLVQGGCRPLGTGDNCFAAAAVTTDKSTTGKAVSQKEASTHTTHWWLLILSMLAALTAIGLLIWRYWHCRKHHGVFGSMQPPADAQVIVGYGGSVPFSRTLRHVKIYVSHHRLFVSICAGIIGAALITGAVAAANNDQPIFEAEASALTGGVKIIADAAASGGKYIVFEINGTPGTVGVSNSNGPNGGSGTGSSSSKATTGGSSSGGSGASSGGGNTGYPYPDRFSVGAPGVSKYRQSDASLPVPAGYTEVFPSDGSSKAYNMYSCSGVTNIDRVYFHAFIYVGTGCHGTINITNSIIAPPPGSNQRAILVNADNSASLTINISNSTIRPEPVPLGGTNNALTDHVLNDCETCSIHMNRVDVANSGGMCLCGKNTLIENSWLHDNYIAHLSDPSLAHTGGVFPYGGSGPLEIRYNRLEPGIDAYNGTEVPNYWKAITAVLFTQSSGGTMLRNYNVHHNFISLGGFNMGLENGENLIIRDNVFGPNHFGHITTCSSGCSVSIATWTNNLIGDISGKPSATILPKPF